MAFQDDKDALLAILTAKCSEVKFINNNANNYAQLLEMFFEFATTFDCNPDYLADLLAIFADATLTGLGVYFNKAGTQNNPKVIVASNYTNVTIDAGGDYEQLQIFNASVIDELIIDNNTNVDILVISGASEITRLDVKSGSCINTLFVKACNDLDSILDKVVEGSCINNIILDDNAIFNGYTCEIETDL